MGTYSAFESFLPEETKKEFQREVAGKKAIVDASALICQAMEEKRLNQKQLADLLGVSKGYISRLIAGHENLSVKNVATVLHVLGKEYSQTIKQPNAVPYYKYDTMDVNITSINIEKPKVANRLYPVAASE
ncbi:MAG: helix-turn-helix transcriptional regulator [Leptospiraceae bacterium]|nr:helix-turn-helix transcriptional regulator [Leptospiraceae bacterium]